jgi:hypothetical protein
MTDAGTPTITHVEDLFVAIFRTDYRLAIGCDRNKAAAPVSITKESFHAGQVQQHKRSRFAAMGLVNYCEDVFK